MNPVRSAAHARQDERRRDAFDDLVARGFTRRHLLRVAALVGAGATVLPARQRARAGAALQRGRDPRRRR